ncbi:MAG: alpha/beta hydrolase family esterase [Thermocrispum sp.]
MNRRTLVAMLVSAGLAATGALATTATADTTAPAHPGSKGCGEPAAAPPGETVTRTIKSAGGTRSYRLHVPQRYRPWRPQAVVLSFHGRTRTAEYQEELSQFSGTGVVAVYPQGLIGTDGEPSWQGAHYSPAVDDVRFVDDLLDELERTLCVDRTRVYATGKSNGGGFTGVLACRMSDRIAAFAPVAGAFYPQGGACHPARPAPLLEIHGKADAIIPYDGDPVKGLPPLPEWLAGWAERDGCLERPVVRDLGDGVHRSHWRGCDRRSDVVHYAVDSLAHDWPSTEPNPDSDQPSVIDATPVILRFFAQHRLNR